MKVLVIGCGSIGTRHVRNLQTLGYTPIAFDVDPRRGGPLTEAGLRRFIYGRTGVAAVLICTPADSHADVARQLRSIAYAGPLFVEKPLVTRLEDAEVFRSWPHPVQMVGYNWRFHPHVAMCSAFIPAAQRSFLHLECETNMAQWPGGARHGDPLLECSHEVDLARHWLGPVQSMIAGELNGGAYVQILHQRGSSLIDLCWQADESSRRISVKYPIDNPAARLIVWPSLGAELNQSYMSEMEHFLGCVQVGRQFPQGASFEDGLAVVEIMQRAQQQVAA